jgi:hypothetical protein
MSLTDIKTMNNFVGGVVNINIETNNFPYAFFEIDTTEQSMHEKVLDTYKKFSIDVVSHRVGKGYHYFGNYIDRQIWTDWYAELKKFNPKYPPLTLRITKKYKEELFERPVYHEVMYKPLNWARSLMHFLNKEMKGENSTNIWSAMRDVGLPNYFKCVVYPLDSTKKEAEPFGLR